MRVRLSVLCMVLAASLSPVVADESVHQLAPLARVKDLEIAVVPAEKRTQPPRRQFHGPRINALDVSFRIGERQAGRSFDGLEIIDWT